MRSEIHTVFYADAESATRLGGIYAKSLYLGSRGSPPGGVRRIPGRAPQDVFPWGLGA